VFFNDAAKNIRKPLKPAFLAQFDVFEAVFESCGGHCRCSKHVLRNKLTTSFCISGTKP
jgi:hypothetical protein